ncbi:MAG TPA: Rieske 2Fe-2S domain-containing protein [Candidatus Binatia bacterium]|jgi:5,5'-dehydrodivanillate O-demethylase
MLTQQDNERLIQIGPETPMGRLLRCYWYPIAAASELTRHPTKQVRILGEDLVLYRDGRGKLGLIGAYCAHRRAGLVYGIPEPDGLRCPYHGWKYDADGRCTEQPFEETVRPEKNLKENIKLPSYQVEELGGLIFGYFGKQPAPLLPRWDLMVEENAWREIGYTTTGCHWLQSAENILDPVHVEWLHGVFRNFAADRTGRHERKRKRIHHVKIAFDLANYGIIKRRILEHETEESDDWKIGHWLVFPCTQKGPDMLRFRVPVDATHTAQWYYSVHPLSEGERQGDAEVPLYDMPSPTLDEHGQPRVDQLDGDVDPQDNAIFVSQEPIFDRTKETLGESDRGVVMYRHLLDHQMKLVEEGKDPMNVFRDAAANVRLELPTESRERFLTGRLGPRARQSRRYRSILRVPA